MRSREDRLLLKLQGLYEETKNPLFVWYVLHRADFQSRALPPWIDVYLKRAASYWHRYGIEGAEEGPAGLLDVAGTPVIPGEGVGPISPARPDRSPIGPCHRSRPGTTSPARLSW